MIREQYPTCEKCKFEILPNTGCLCRKYSGKTAEDEARKRAQDQFRADLESEQDRLYQSDLFPSTAATTNLPRWAEDKQRSFSSMTSSNVVFNDDFDKKGKGKESTTSYVKCAHSHPPLKVNDKITVYGGAAHSPIVKDADIYVSLDYDNEKSGKQYPWNNEKGVQYIHFYIPDMNTPKDTGEFKKMITWLKGQAEAGKKIHVGCIGGHGRTGMLLSALVKEIAGVEDAIKFVRENYCKKAVEASCQVDFLNKEYGIKKQPAYKSYTYSGSGSSKNWSAEEEYLGGGKKGKGSYKGEASRHNEKFGYQGDDVAIPADFIVGADGNVWGIE